MGTWGIARDMAKLNEENLSKLSRKGLYAKLKERGSKSNGKIYKFKKATPQALDAIRQKMEVENKAYNKRRLKIIIGCLIFGLFLFWLIFADLSFII